MNNNHPSREKGPAPPVQPKEKAGQDLPQNIPAPPETDTITNTPDTPSDSTLRRREWQPPSFETLLKRYGTDLLAYLTLPDAPAVSDPDLEAQFRFQHRGTSSSTTRPRPAGPASCTPPPFRPTCGPGTSRPSAPSLKASTTWSRSTRPSTPSTNRPRNSHPPSWRAIPECRPEVVTILT